MCLASRGTFDLEISSAEADAAERLLRDVLRWPRESTSSARFTAPTDTEPLVELAHADGPAAFYALHVEVDDLDAVMARADWMKLVAERQERPAGRDIVSLGWAGWPFQVGLYTVRPGYWAWPPRHRLVAIAHCPEPERLGWPIVHEWRVGGRHGYYLRPPGPLRVSVTIQPGAERLAVTVSGTDLLSLLD